MGILSGIYLKSRRDIDIKNKIFQMLSCQKHRDRSEPVFLVEENFALGMANSQNFVYEKRNSKTIKLPKETSEAIIAFVDGIVLDVLKHKRELEKEGYRIPIASSTEIVAAAYKKWGMDFMRHLEGEFACAVWDANEKKLVLARDPYGHKPLHYYADENMFVFSSEIKGVLAAGVPREIDMGALSNFLSLNCVPCPGTMFKNIKQVSPGMMLVISQGSITEKEFWRHEFKVDEKISFEEAILQVSDKIRKAVVKRLTSDETYCFLSGGIDSSAIVSFTAELSSKPVNAVTVGFDEAEVDELESAKIMAKHVGAKHHHVVAKPDSFFDMLDTLVFHHDSPFTDTSAYPSYYAGKLARGFTDVILTGDGPDQTMGGSGHHVFAVKKNIFKPRNIISRYLNRMGAETVSFIASELKPSTLAKIQRKLYRNSLSPVHAAYDLRSFFPDIVKKSLCSKELWQIHLNNNPYQYPESWFGAVKDVDDINKYLYADIKFYILDDLMIKVDRMCMAHGLETLSPFQDIELAKAVNSLPGSFKIRTENGSVNTKYILKKVCEKRFPSEILGKKKQGFGIPLEKWMRQDNGEFLKKVLLEDKSLNRGYFNKKVLEKLIVDFIDGNSDYFYANASSMVALLTLELWHRKYFS